MRLIKYLAEKLISTSDKDKEKAKKAKLKEKAKENDRLQYTYDTIIRDCGSYLKSADFNSKMLLYRGIRDGETLSNTQAYITKPEKPSIHKITMRKGRIPKGTNPELFPLINKWLLSNDFISRDDATFATTNIKHAQNFGAPHIMVPIGNYKFTYVKAKDFNFPASTDTWNPCVLVWHLRDKILKISPDTIKFLNLPDDISISNTTKLFKWLEANPKTEISVTDLARGYETKVETKQYKEWISLEKKLKSYLSNKDLASAITNSWELWFNCKEYYLIDEREFEKIIKKYKL